MITNSKFVNGLLSGVFLLTSMACQKAVESNNSPDPIINKSFVIKLNTQAGSPDLTNNKAEIRLRKTALDKEFLIRTNVIDQNVVPMFSAGRSRVVYFSRVFNFIIAYESSPANFIDSNNPTKRILARFPILSESNDEIGFDFNEGMSNLFSAAWDEENDRVELTYQLIPVETSFIQDASFNQNRLVISQMARLMQPNNESEGEDESEANNSVEKPPVFRTVEVKYFISPYFKNAQFQPTEFKGIEKMGYFATDPIYKDSENIVRYSMKFDINRPIVFALSANTPMELRPALREAILYWNKAFGKNIVEVIELKDLGTRAPQPDINIVQWVEYPTAAFAYADMQDDPMTGETLNAQILLPSGFYFHSKETAERILRSFKIKRPVLRWALQGFQPLRHCRKEMTPLLGEVQQVLSNSAVTDSEIQKLSSNYMASTLAHEVGHVLGLRHNFAGNLAANHRATDLPALVGAYLKTGTVPVGTMVSSSVMDYTISEEDILQGAQIRDPKDQAFAYDRIAIRSLYLSETFKDEDIPLFCTDDHLEIFMDCYQFDSGNRPIESFAFSNADYLKFLGARILEVYIQNKISGKEISEAAIDPARIANRLMENRSYLYSQLTTKAQLRRVARKYEYSKLFSQDIRMESLKETSHDFSELGGVSSTLPIPRNEMIDSVYQDFDKFLSKEPQGIRQGKAYSFSQAEQVTMRRNTKAALRKTYALLIKADLTLSEVKLADFAPADDFEKLTEAKAQYFGLSKASGQIEGEVFDLKGKMSKVKLPIFQFDKEIRALAFTLTAWPSERADWGYHLKENLKAAAGAEMMALRNSPDKIDWNKTSPEVRRWYFEQKSLFESLGLE